MSSDIGKGEWITFALTMVFLGIISLFVSCAMHKGDLEREQKAHEEELAAKEAEADARYREGLYVGFMKDIKKTHPAIDTEWQNRYISETFKRSSLRRNPPTSLDIEYAFMNNDLVLTSAVSDIYDALPEYKAYKVTIVTKRMKYELIADYEMVEKAYQLELDKGFQINPKKHKRLLVINPSQVKGEVLREVYTPNFTVKGELTGIYELPAECKRGESFCDFAG